MTFPLNNFQSFEKALEEVYNLNWFPIRQPMMKAALEYVETMQMMKEEVGCFALQKLNLQLCINLLIFGWMLLISLISSPFSSLHARKTFPRM